MEDWQIEALEMEEIMSREEEPDERELLEVGVRIKHNERS